MVVPPSLVAMGRHRSPFLPCTMAVADWREVGIVGSTMLDYRSLSKGVRKRHELRLDSFVISVKVGMRAPIRLAFVVAISSTGLSSSFATGFSFSSSTSATSTASLLTKCTFHPRFGGHVVASLSASSTTRLNAATAKELAESGTEESQISSHTWPYAPRDFDRRDGITRRHILHTTAVGVYHIDSNAVEALTKYYTNVFQRVETDVLDVL